MFESSKSLLLRFSPPGKKIPHSSVHYFLAQSQGNSLSFRCKRTVTLCWNLGSEHLLTNTLLTKLLDQCIELHTVLFSFFLCNIFGKLGVNLKGLVVKVLDSQSRSPVFKTIGWIQGRRRSRLIKWVPEISWNFVL